MPVVGTALLLAGGLAPARWGPQPLLSVPPVRAIGDWSYSIYLWHWPPLIFLAALWRQPSGWSGVAVLAGVIAVSGLTYRYVEQPWRRAKILRAGPRRGVLLYPAVVVLTLPFLADTQFVETGQWFCARGQCPTVIGGFIARRDRSHMSTPYAEYLVPELDERLRIGD